MNIARQGQQLLLRQHGNALFPHGVGGLFQAQCAVDRHVEHIIPPRCAHRDQRFEHAVGLYARQRGHGLAVHRVRIIAVRLMRYPLRVQQAQGVGFLLGFLQCDSSPIPMLRVKRAWFSALAGSRVNPVPVIP